MIWFIKTGGYQAAGEGACGEFGEIRISGKYLCFSGCDN